MAGRLIVISAPSGAGKTTVVERLLRSNRNLRRSVSFTTRPKRPNEKNGRDYFFVSRKEFLAKKKKGFFLEFARVFGCFYGTSEKFVLDRIKRGFDLILAVDVQGMRQLEKKRAKIPTVSIFLMPPSLKVLKKRLERRNTEGKNQIEKRLKVAKREIKACRRYDFIVVNQKLDQAVKEIEGILKHGHSTGGTLEKRR
jgi:guanylate kinase